MVLTLFLSLAGCLLVTQADLSDDQIRVVAISKSQFREEYADAFCEAAESCGMIDQFGGDLGTCIDLYDEALAEYLADPDCFYDGAEAAACVEEVAAAACSDLDNLDGNVVPSCTRVCG